MTTRTPFSRRNQYAGAAQEITGIRAREAWKEAASDRGLALTARPGPDHPLTRVANGCAPRPARENPGSGGWVGWTWGRCEPMTKPVPGRRSRPSTGRNFNVGRSAVLTSKAGARRSERPPSRRTRWGRARGTLMPAVRVQPRVKWPVTLAAAEGVDDRGRLRRGIRQ